MREVGSVQYVYDPDTLQDIKLRGLGLTEQVNRVFQEPVFSILGGTWYPTSFRADCRGGWRWRMRPQHFIQLQVPVLGCRLLKRGGAFGWVFGDGDVAPGSGYSGLSVVQTRRDEGTEGNLPSGWSNRAEFVARAECSLQNSVILITESTGGSCSSFLLGSSLAAWVGLVMSSCTRRLPFFPLVISCSWRLPVFFPCGWTRP